MFGTLSTLIIIIVAGVLSLAVLDEGPHTNEEQIQTNQRAAHDHSHVGLHSLGARGVVDLCSSGVEVRVDEGLVRRAHVLLQLKDSEVDGVDSGGAHSGTESEDEIEV